MAAAKHRAIDLVRRRSLLDRKHGELGRELEEKQENCRGRLRRSARRRHWGRSPPPDFHRRAIRCFRTEAQLALTLRLLGGLTTDEIARAFLVPESTIAQRIVRAKRTLADAHVPYEVPRGAERAERLASVFCK